MFVNYGDKDFYENGLLVDDAVGLDGEVRVIVCMPCSYLKDRYLFADCYVNTTDSWIDKDVINIDNISGCGSENALKALACIEHYGVHEFAEVVDTVSRSDVEYRLLERGIEINS